MFFIENGDIVLVIEPTRYASKTGKVLGRLVRIIDNFGPVPFYEVRMEKNPGLLLIREDVFKECYEVVT